MSPRATALGRLLVSCLLVVGCARDSHASLQDSEDDVGDTGALSPDAPRSDAGSDARVGSARDAAGPRQSSDSGGSTPAAPGKPSDASLPVDAAGASDASTAGESDNDSAAETSDQPLGFGRATTGGRGGAVVRVDNIADLKAALCRTQSGKTCTDDEPRIVELASTVFDFTGTEGKAREQGCTVKDCTGGVESEFILNRQNWCGTRRLFSVEYDTAGANPLLVGSNKTVIGTGSGATLKGKGLSLRGGVHNIIIRNLTITSINPQVVWGGDALTIDDADRVWIDHNRFSLIGRQMVVTGFGKASHVTFSHNEFDGRTPYSGTCNGAHYWALLLLGANDTLTFQGNWLHDISGRAPHAGGLMNAANAIQFVNNYFQHFPGHALEPLTDKTNMLLEGNYFDDVDQPLQANDAAHVFAPVASDSVLCQQKLGRACVANVIAGSTSNKLPLDQTTLGAFDSAAVEALVKPAKAESVPTSVPANAGPRP